MKKIILLMMMVTTVVFFNSCKEGPVGEIGPKGETGDQGPTGATGANGIDGEDGETVYGYEEALESGYIAMVIEGTRPDDVALKDSSVYKFCPLESVDRFSAVYYDEVNDDYYFTIVRFSDLAIGTDSRTAGFYVAVDFYYDGTDVIIEGGEASYLMSIIEGNKVYNLLFNFNPLDYIIEDGITNYSYTPETGKVTLKVEMLIPGAENDTGNDLKMTAYMDVTAYLNLSPMP